MLILIFTLLFIDKSYIYPNSISSSKVFKGIPSLDLNENPSIKDLKPILS